MATFTMFSYEFKGIEKLAQGEENQTELRFDDVDVKKSIAHKQEIFQSFFTLESFPTHFTLGNRRYACQLQWSKQGIIVFKISNKHTLRQDKEFQTNILDTEPWTIVVIDNRKDRQLIAILKRPQAFRDNSAVAKLLQKNLTPFLHKQRLAIQIDAQYHAQDVWKLIDQYRPQGIQYIEFLLPFPNKPWITKTFREVMDVALTANG